MAPGKQKVMPWRSKCIVKGCSTRVCSGVPMHGFPKSDRYPELYDHWVEAVREANSTPLWIPHKSAKVCAFHFETVGNIRIRVPTLFPSNEWHTGSAAQDENDYDDDEDPTVGMGGYNSNDSMDAYEDSMAVQSIITEEVADHEEVEEEPVTYEEIEEEYNNIVGDVVSTLVTYDSMDNEAMFNEGDEQNTVTLYGGISDDGTAALHSNMEAGSSTSNDVIKEVVYNHVHDGCDNDVGPENIEYNVDDDEYCPVGIKHPLNAESMDEQLDSHSENSPEKKNPSELPTKKGRGRPRKLLSMDEQPANGGEDTTEKRGRGRPRKLESMGEAPENSEDELPVNNEEETTTKSRYRPRKLESLYESPENSEDELPEDSDEEGSLYGATTKKQRGRPRKFASLDELPVNSEEDTSRCGTAFKKGRGRPRKFVSMDELPANSEEETKTKRGRGRPRKLETSNPEDAHDAKGNLDDPKSSEKRESPKSSIEGEENASTELVADVKRLEGSPLERMQEKLSSPPKRQVEFIKGARIEKASLDGEPIKLKECSVTLVKSPLKPKPKKEVSVSTSSSDTAKKGKLEKGPEKDSAITSGPVDLLGALSLKSSQEDENAGLRRSARIRAGAGKKRGRKSWSVAFKETPKKKLKMDECSVSSESVPYEFETEDDPDIDPGDLCDTDSESSWVSDIDDKEIDERHEARTSARRKPKISPNPAPKTNGYAGKASRIPILGRYQRVKWGDQATQVGLPGSCDGFIFDVVRDDPRNVGVSCNIFYQYHPKHSRRFSRLRTETKNLTQPKVHSSGSTRITDRSVPKSMRNVGRNEIIQPNQPSTSRTKQSNDFEWGKIIESNSSERCEPDGESPRNLLNRTTLENVDITEGTKPRGDLVFEGIKVEPAMDSGVSGSLDYINQEIKEEDPSDLSEVDVGGPSRSDGGVRCDGDSDKCPMASKQHADSIRCSTENEEAMDAPGDRRDKTPERGRNAEDVASSLADLAGEAVNRVTDTMVSCVAPQTATVEKIPEPTSSPSVERAECAMDVRNEDTADVPLTAHSDCTELLDKSHPVTNFPAESGHEPIRVCCQVEHSSNTSGDQGVRPASSRLNSDTIMDSSDVVEPEVAVEGHDGPLADSSNENSSGGNSKGRLDTPGSCTEESSRNPSGPMDFDDPQEGLDPVADYEKTAAAETSNREEVDSEAVCGKPGSLDGSISAEPAGCRNGEAPMDSVDVQMNSESAEHREAVGIPRREDLIGETVDSDRVEAAGILASLESDNQCGASKGAVDSAAGNVVQRDDVTGKDAETPVNLDSDNPANPAPHRGSASSPEPEIIEMAPTERFTIPISDAPVEPVLLSSDSEDLEPVVISSEDEASPTTCNVARQLSQPCQNPPQIDATTNGYENSQDVFDNVERNLEKMFEMEANTP